MVHNFGMPRPEGYRKALRVMKLAEQFKIPIVAIGVGEKEVHLNQFKADEFAQALIN